MENNGLPRGFITIQQAIELIESDTRRDPVVDTAFLLRNIPYLKLGQNYNIKLLTRDDDGRIVENGSKYVQILTERDLVNLREAIGDHYKLVTGRNVDTNSIGLRRMTTVSDDEKNPAAKNIVNEESKIKFGDELSTE